MGRGKKGSRGSVSKRTGQTTAENNKTVVQPYQGDEFEEGQGRLLKDYGIPLLIAVVCLAVYWQVRGHAFIYFDDRVYVFENRQVLKGLSWESVLWAFGFSGKDQPYWHPLTWLSHMADVQIFGLDSGMHHLVNVLFHTMNVLLLFLVLRLMTGEMWKSGFVAALFALHPVNVDTVAWVAERKNLLSTFFWLLVMLSYYFYAKRPGVARYGALAGVFVVGLLSKPMLVTLPFVLLLLDYWPLGRVRFGQEAFGSRSGIEGREVKSVGGLLFSPAVLDKIPLIVLSFVSIYVSMFSLQLGGNPVSLEEVPMVLRLENAIVSYAGYLREAILPYGLAVFYPFPRMIPLWKVMASLVLLISMTAGVVVTMRKRPYLLVGWLWFAVTIVPVSGIVQAGLWPAMADRWAYVPFMGLFIMAAWGVPELVKNLSAKREILGASGAAVLVVLSVITWKQIGFWKDSDSLFVHAFKITGNNYIIQKAMGESLFYKGDIDGAISHYSESLRFKPNDSRILINLGSLHLRKGKLSDAARYFARATQVGQDRSAAHYGLAMTYEGSGKLQEAAVQYKRAIEMDPGLFQAYNRLGLVLARTGEYDEAVRCCVRALSLDPANLEVRINLATIYLGCGKFDEAIGHYEKALQADPNISVVHNGIGIALLKKGRAEKAAAHFREALRLAPGNAGVMMNLKRAEAMGNGQ